MFIIELLILLVALALFGLVVTQMVIPSWNGTRTWWLFRKGSPMKCVVELEKELSEEEARTKTEALKEAIKDEQKRRERGARPPRGDF